MMIRHKLGREATSFEIGSYVKNLNYLNRNLKNVVYVGSKKDEVKYNLENVVLIPEFTGDVNDKELLQSIQFLKDMAKPNVKDIRQEITKYGNFKPYIKYYKSIPKYKKLLSKEDREESN